MKRTTERGEERKNGDRRTDERAEEGRQARTEERLTVQLMITLLARRSRGNGGSLLVQMSRDLWLMKNRAFPEVSTHSNREVRKSMKKITMEPQFRVSWPYLISFITLVCTGIVGGYFWEFGTARDWTPRSAVLGFIGAIVSPILCKLLLLILSVFHDKRAKKGRFLSVEDNQESGNLEIEAAKNENPYRSPKSK